ncbi:MAG TPA: L-2-amino-thiazoline-4-carboxylic acid hydrolase [Phototrophicaceae bacterium]|nr:L-2-amino-thiazoline-4-carboxylic acid hydrolase [Phototrophicaceae bacterium]
MTSDEIGQLKNRLFQKECYLLESRAALAAAMVEHFGEEAEAVLRNFLKNSVRNWAVKTAEADLAANKPNDIPGLMDFLWGPLREEGFEFTCDQTDQGYQMNVTRCPIAEIARSRGLEKWGYIFHCMGDEAIAEGYNPAIGMTRTKMLMNGDEYCNHFYFYRE